MFLGFCHALLPRKHWGGLYDVISQPPKLKFLLGRHLATNSFGLGRLFLSASCHLQNFRRHGDQNGRDLEGSKPKECQCGEATVVVHFYPGCNSYFLLVVFSPSYTKTNRKKKKVLQE